MPNSSWAIIHEVSQQAVRNPAAREKEQFRATAQSLGAKIIDIPANWARHSDAESALADLAPASQPIPTILSGFIHPADDYAELYEAAAQHNYLLLNDPRQYQRSHSMREALPLLAELTPRSAFIETIEEISSAIHNIGLPAFVKGDVQSRKDRGWKACVAITEDELEDIAQGLLDSYAWSEGYVVIRELVPLRHARTQPDGFPIGREFRAILFQNHVVGLGYYWPGDDPLSQLTDEEEQKLHRLAVQSSERLQVPFLVVDIGQTESGEWIAIETGDPQTAGFGLINVRRMLESIITHGAW